MNKKTMIKVASFAGILGIFSFTLIFDSMTQPTEKAELIKKEEVAIDIKESDAIFIPQSDEKLDFMTSDSDK